MDKLMEEAAQGQVDKDWSPVHEALVQALCAAVLAAQANDVREQEAQEVEEKRMWKRHSLRFFTAAQHIATMIQEGRP